MIEPARAIYTFGNARAPVGIGAFTVELSEGVVVLTHERYTTRRTWKARAEDSLGTRLVLALEGAKFPAPPSTRSAPAGTASFSLRVTWADGSTAETSGFGSIEYREVSLLFLHVVSQMSKDIVLGFEECGETVFIRDVHEERSPNDASS